MSTQEAAGGVLPALGTMADQLGWDRLNVALTAVGVPCYRGKAPYDIAKSGECFVTLMEAETGWQRDSYHQSNRHPVLVANVWADDTRNEQGEPVAADARSKALGVYEYLDRLLDLQTAKQWPAVISSVRQGEPSMHDVPDGDGAVLLSARYELNV